VKLYARTSAGIGLGLNVLLTGQVKVLGKLYVVEVILPFGCACETDISSQRKAANPVLFLQGCPKVRGAGAPAHVFGIRLQSSSLFRRDVRDS
jgi:hypothetical protein